MGWQWSDLVGADFRVEGLGVTDPSPLDGLQVLCSDGMILVVSWRSRLTGCSCTPVRGC